MIFGYDEDHLPLKSFMQNLTIVLWFNSSNNKVKLQTQGESLIDTDISKVCIFLMSNKTLMLSGFKNILYTVVT